MTYYVIFRNRIFQKTRSLRSALAIAKGNDKQVFAKVAGIPNPWFVHPVINNKVNKNKILKPKQLDAIWNKTVTGLLD